MLHGAAPETALASDGALRNQDTVLDAAVNVGMMREVIALKLARRMERAVYAGVDRIGIISEGFRTNLLAKEVHAQYLHFCPNGPTRREFDATPPAWAADFPSGDFVVLHAGSIGAKQRLEMCCGRWKRSTRVFLGGGNRADDIQSEAQRLKRPIKLTPQRAADVLLINQASAEVDALVPSRLLTNLFAEKAGCGGGKRVQRNRALCARGALRPGG